MRRALPITLLAVTAALFLACEEVRPLVDKGGDNGEGTSDVAATGTGTGTTATGTGGADGGMGTGGKGGGTGGAMPDAGTD